MMTTTRKSNVIAIDTGSNGGISIFTNGEVKCSPFVDVENALKFIKENCGSKIGDFSAVVETLNIFSNVNGSKNTVYKQGVSFGVCIGLLKGLGINDIELVSAKKWQSYLDLPKGIDYKERKSILENKAEELFPKEMSIKKTKKYKSSICDSLLILKYYLDFHGKCI